MRSIPRRWRLAALAAGSALAIFIPVSGASAATTTLNGDWAPFNRCPVENSTMLAATGSTSIAFCLASDSPSGSMTLGNTTVSTGDVNLQVGLVENPSTGAFTVVAPSGGAVSAAAVTIPGGLLGLICPSGIVAVTAICDEITNSTLNTVTAVVSSAGTPSAFNLGAGLSTGEPILSIPVKIQLVNPLLGSDCYIGSDSDPVVLQPGNLIQPTVQENFFDTNGTADPNGPLFQLAITGTAQEDDTFAVPGASGCGLLGILDSVVDLKEGLPAASGSNSLTLNNASSYLGGINDPTTVEPNEGQALADYWNSAVS